MTNFNSHNDIAGYHHIMSPDAVEVRIVEDDDVPQGECYVSGWFNPVWFESGEDYPILIEVAINCEADVDEDDQQDIHDEIVTAINHEMVHHEQFVQGRFINKWEGDYNDNPNEIEAYERESQKEFYS